MQSTLKPKPADDPHDVLVVAPDLVRVAPAEEELSSLLREAARQHAVPARAFSSEVGTGSREENASNQKGSKTQPDRAAGAAVPSVDTTFRAAAVDDGRRPMARRAGRGFIMLLLVACLGGAGVAWQAYGDEARALIATSAPEFFASLLPAQKPDTSVQPAAPAVETEAADAAPAPAPAAATPAISAQPAAPPQAAPDAAAPAAAPAAAAPSPESAALLQSMARDVASLTQQVEALKASVDQLKASQQQISRDAAKAADKAADKAAEPNPRPKIAKLSATPPRPIVRPRQPMPIYQPAYPPPQAQIAPPPQAAAPYPLTAPYYAPRQAEPPAAAPSDDPELSAVPRPPMPLR
jgi:hypothetical protein